MMKVIHDSAILNDLSSRHNEERIYIDGLRQPLEQNFYDSDGELVYSPNQSNVLTAIINERNTTSVGLFSRNGELGDIVSDKDYSNFQLVIWSDLRSSISLFS